MATLAVRPVLGRLGLTPRLLRFATVGLAGVAVNSALLAVASAGLGVHYLVGAVVATIGSTTFNFGLTERWVFGDRGRRRPLAARYGGFLAMSLAALGVRGPLLVGLTELAGLHYLLSNLISLGALMLIRYELSGRLIWSEGAR